MVFSGFRRCVQVAHFRERLTRCVVIGHGLEQRATEFADRQIRSPAVPIHDLSRHTESTAPGNALPGHISESRRKPCLLRDHSERAWTTFRIVDSNAIAAKESQTHPARL